MKKLSKNCQKKIEHLKYLLKPVISRYLSEILLICKRKNLLGYIVYFLSIPILGMVFLFSFLFFLSFLFYATTEGGEKR